MITDKQGNEIKAGDIPDFLLEMSRRMHTQDNRITADPIWQVRHKGYIATGKGINEHHIEVYNTTELIFRSDKDEYHELFSAIYQIGGDMAKFIRDWCHYELSDDTELDTDDEYIEYAADHFDLDYDNLPDEIDLVYCQEVEKIVSTHLTEADANWFIKRKQHDYPPLYTYVESAYWSPEIKELRAWVKSLTGEESCNT